MHTPLVSVLMTSFNREKYIADAIQSVLASTFSNFEFIIVDDCSNDNTVSIAKKFAENDNRMKLYINDKNLGDYPNRNKAASYAKGKYLKYLDSDDTMSPDCLEIMVSRMEANPECAFGVSSRSLKYVTVHFPHNSFRVHFFERGILDNGPSAVIIRNDVFIEHGGFSGKRCVSDFELWFRIALVYPLVEMEKDLIFWRRHDKQETNLMSHIEQNLKHTLPIIENTLEKCLLESFEKKIIIRKQKKQIMRFLIKNCFKLGFIKAMLFKKMNKLKFLDAL
jgi:glycosyltransferase involved in cell wall biosynthesis